MWFLIGLAVGLGAGFVVFRLYWAKEISAGRNVLTQIQGAVKKL